MYLGLYLFLTLPLTTAQARIPKLLQFLGLESFSGRPHVLKMYASLSILTIAIAYTLPRYERNASMSRSSTASPKIHLLSSSLSSDRLAWVKPLS